MSSSLSLYEVLGVTQHASLEEIRHAYRQAARRLHPDKAGQQQAQQAEQAQQHQQGHRERHDSSQPLNGSMLSSSQPGAVFSEAGAPAAAGAAAAAEQFLSVQRAWEVLSDPVERGEHDRQLALQASRAEVHINEEVALSEMGDNIEVVEGEPCYAWPCRCGGRFLLPRSDVCLGNAELVVVACSTCSLHIQVALLR